MLVSVRITGADVVAAGVARVAKKLNGSLSSIGRPLTDSALKTVVKLTPTNRYAALRDGTTKRGFDSLRSQWGKVENISSKVTYQAIVHNKAYDSPAGTAVLASIEAGAAPHAILPHGEYALRWSEPGFRQLFTGRTSSGPQRTISDSYRRKKRAGDVVYSVGVNHPGNVGFHMVQQTKEIIRDLAGVALKELADEIGATFGQLSISVD